MRAGIDVKGELRDFALQLARRGFVTIAIGSAAPRGRMEESYLTNRGEM
jgi:hypothetical protein